MLAPLVVAGCGFHLQGEVTAPPEMQRTYIEPLERNTQFHRELRRQMQASGVELVDAPDEATAILTITEDDTGQRVLSVSARNVPTEYEVYYTIEYGIVSGQESIRAPQRITLTRDYTWDETLVLGKTREEDLLREAIVRDLVRRVLKQISTL